MKFTKPLWRAGAILGMALAFPALAAQGTMGVQASTPLPELSSTFLSSAHVLGDSTGPKGAIGTGQRNQNFSQPLNLDSIPSFTQLYFKQGFDGYGNATNTWYTNSVGNAPNLGGTTTIDAPVVPVTLNLLDPSGNVLATYSPSQYVNPVMNSPVFQNYSYRSSSTPTQFNDAFLRTEYYNQASSNWHTMLSGHVVTGRTMNVPYGYYYAIPNANGTCCLAVLMDINAFGNLLFPSTPTDTTTPIGAAEHAGQMTTHSITTFLFPNTFLYFGNPNNCCVLGYHSWDYEPGDATNGYRTRAYVMNYSSWISPGLFGAGFQDITALSHEMSETFADPFVVADGIHDMTPWWQAPNGNCQDNLEVGDVIEGLPNATYPISMNGYTYHPQNVALNQWFEGQAHSSALGGAYSFPNPFVLPQTAVSQPYNCTP
ncbi:MAG TPA: hypothetical protein VFB58_10490 [Chloroflexota bacterium]|nr:hypothetical protein [Chloroflexota bacterium]